MKTTLTFRIGLLAFLFIWTPGLQPSLCAQGTAFTYQGKLNSTGVALNATADLQYSLWNAASGGIAIARNFAVGGISYASQDARQLSGSRLWQHPDLGLGTLGRACY